MTVPEAPAVHTGPRTSQPPKPWRPDLRFALGVALSGVCAAGFAIAFHAAFLRVIALLAHAGDIVSAMRALPPWARCALPAFGGLLAGGFGVLAARGPSGQGVADVMEAVVLGRVELSMRVTLWKCAASFCAIASGGSIGREGPMIQFAGTLGKFVGDRLGVGRRDVRLLIAAGTAAGFAAAYNTPFAAVLFVLEVVTGVVVLDAILPALVATVIATALTRAVLGGGPIYGQRAFSLQSPLELAAFFALGVLSAFFGQLFMRLLSLGEYAFERSRIALPWRSAFGGALAGLVVAFLPEVAGNGYEALDSLLDGRFSIGFIALLLLGKALATTASVSSGSPGGVFTPTLLLGAAVGVMFARVLSFAGIVVGPSGGYALVGMAAAIAATTHAPMTAAVMVFELSGDYAIALPLLLATAIATLISRRLRRDSIYTAELAERGIGWELTFEGRRMRGGGPGPLER